MQPCSDQFVHCLFATVDGHYKGYVTFMYAHNCIDKRKKLWAHLVQFSSSLNLPWIVLGDFNVVLDATENIFYSGSQFVLSTELNKLFLLGLFA